MHETVFRPAEPTIRESSIRRARVACVSRCGPEPGTPDLIGEGLLDRPNTMRFQNVLLVVLIASVTTLASAIDGKCSACVAVASSLQAALELERPRVHVDMRGRLDSKGKRYGKLIEYKVSELRFVELLEGLCDAVGEKYGLQGGIWRTGKSDGKPAFGAKSPPEPTSGDGDRNGLPSLRRSASTSGEAGIAGARRWRGHRMGDECDEIARTRDEPRQETPYKTKTQIPRNRCDRPDSFFP